MHVIKLSVSNQTARWQNPCRVPVEGTAGPVTLSAADIKRLEPFVNFIVVEEAP